jgi:hypothetical protein
LKKGGGGEFKRSEGMKRYFSRVDSLMPLTWEKKGRGGKKRKERWDKNEADRGNKREEKERKRERE